MMINSVWFTLVNSIGVNLIVTLVVQECPVVRGDSSGLSMMFCLRCWRLLLVLPARVKTESESPSPSTDRALLINVCSPFQIRAVHEFEELLSLFQNFWFRHPRHLGDGPIRYLQLSVSTGERGKPRETEQICKWIPGPTSNRRY